MSWFWGPAFIMNKQNKQTNQLLQGINLKITLQPDKTNEKKKKIVIKNQQDLQLEQCVPGWSWSYWKNNVSVVDFRLVLVYKLYWLFASKVMISHTR